MVVKCSQDFLDCTLSVKILRIVIAGRICGSCVAKEYGGGFQNEDKWNILEATYG